MSRGAGSLKGGSATNCAEDTLMLESFQIR
jgi:hypothetical protein